MMGSGKSTIGSLLSRTTGWPYLDNDVLVERARRTTARELLGRAGENELRMAETAALQHGLAEPPPCILGAAGGTILDPVNREAMKRGALVVWLRASPEVLAARAIGAHHRPWLESDPEGWMRDALEARSPLYEEVADLSVHTDGRSAYETAAEIRAWLSDSQPCSEWLNREHD
jgi:shikimate kinase